MMDIRKYDSPLGEILLCADEAGLTGLWFVGQRYAPALPLSGDPDAPFLRQTVRWLDLYFAGQIPDFSPRLHLTGTKFQLSVWDALLKIPYGETVSYGQLARALGIAAAQAVGGAVSRNPVSLIVPCHRVVGADGSLTGYAGGVARKQWLLALEQAH